MFGLSPTELIIVGVVAVLLFGSRLPSVARSMGKSLTEFRRGMSDLQSDFRQAMNESEAAVTEGTQGRLPRAAEVIHDDSASDEAYDRHEVEPADESADAAPVAESDAETVPTDDPSRRAN